MYNDTIKVANKIISDKDISDIFQKMDEEIKKNEQLCHQEILQNEKYERAYQHWTVKDFSAQMKCTFDFYDDTSVTIDNYTSIITIFNNRLPEIKSMYVRYSYSYFIQSGSDFKTIIQHINMSIYETKMDIDVSLSSEDKKMDDVYKMIKERILTSPEKYDRIIKKRNSINNKINLAIGLIPSMIICSLLCIVPVVRDIYGMTYVLFPIATFIFAFIIGGVVCSGKMNGLYSTLVPEKKYAGYDSTNHKSVYKDDIDKFVSTSEIIIGKNADNMQKRTEIATLEEKYSKYIPIELIVLLVLSIVAILI